MAHILALSGSHIAVLVLALGFLFRALGRLNHKGQFIGGILVCVVLLAYMVITGLSPSVVRACIMGCLYVLAGGIQRKANIENILFLTALIQILIEPAIIFDIGFQFSYIAVLGLIWLYPSLSHLLEIKIQANKNILQISPASYYLKLALAWLCSLILETLIVTLVAHGMIFILGIYYFGTTQTYFVLSNLLVVSLSIWAMWVGIIFLAFYWIPYLSSLLAFVLEKLLYWMNESSLWIAQLPGALISGLSIELFQVFLYYIVVGAFILFIRTLSNIRQNHKIRFR